MKKNNKVKYKAKKYSSSKKYHKKEPSKKKHNQNVYVNNSTSHTAKPRKHKSGLNWFINEKGEYNEKPHFANFWKEGFLNDIPTRADYGRIMDGIKYSDSFVDRNEYQTDEEYKAALKSYEHDHLYGLERMQISLMRLLNGSPREWIKLIFRIALILLVLGLLRLLFS